MWHGAMILIVYGTGDIWHFAMWHGAMILIVYGTVTYWHFAMWHGAMILIVYGTVTYGISPLFYCLINDLLATSPEMW